MIVIQGRLHCCVSLAIVGTVLNIKSIGRGRWLRLGGHGGWETGPLRRDLFSIEEESFKGRGQVPLVSPLVLPPMK